MVGEHKHRSVERRVVSPPSFPSFVRPGTTNWPKHIPPNNPSSNIGDTASHEVVIDARCPALTLNHLLKRSGRDGPLVQRSTTDAEGVREVLLGACAVAIDGDGEPSHLESSHEEPFDAFVQSFA